MYVNTFYWYQLISLLGLHNVSRQQRNISKLVLFNWRVPTDTNKSELIRNGVVFIYMLLQFWLYIISSKGTAKKWTILKKCVNYDTLLYSAFCFLLLLCARVTWFFATNISPTKVDLEVSISPTSRGQFLTSWVGPQGWTMSWRGIVHPFVHPRGEHSLMFRRTKG
jgi:hypothetical protein